MYLCHSCHQEVNMETKIGRQDTCPNCYADLHCCLNCRFHDPGRQNECMEPHAGFIRDREGANFCHCFEFKTSSFDDDDTIMNAKSKLEAMFRNLR